MGSDPPQLVVELCYDVGSPYSCLALEILLRYEQRWRLRLLLTPVLVGAIHRATGNAMPAMVPARGRWLARDLDRNARFVGWPFAGVPKGFGSPAFNTLLCQRLLTAVARDKGSDSSQLRQLSRAMFGAIWGGQPGADLDITWPEFLSTCCRRAGFDEAETNEYLAGGTKSEEVKRQLKDATSRAVDRGAFGAPSIFVSCAEEVLLANGKRLTAGREVMFFGSDRFEQMAFWFGRQWEGPNPPRPQSKL